MKRKMRATFFAFAQKLKSGCVVYFCIPYPCMNYWRDFGYKFLQQVLFNRRNYVCPLSITQNSKRKFCSQVHEEW